jgi:selenide,water dikinase
MRVADYFIELFRQRDIAFVPGYRVQSIEQQQIIGVGKEPLHSDFTVWAINAGAPQWLSNSEIALDEQGFVLVSEKLQSTSHANIFAAGDCANFAARALPKSGVYAVRQGPVLAQNLRRVARGKALLKYRPQRTFLSLLATGERNAVASKGRLFTSGPWVWRWKSHIDRKFMQRFTELPTRSAMPAISTPGEQMRCGGCGAKVGGEALQNVLEQLALDGHGGGDIVQDDAAVFTPPVGQQMVQTIDHFRAFIDDPYLVGRIGANHCLGDIYAMGATPDSALALANVPFGHPRIMQDTLYQMMRGALDCLQEANTALLGGHSSEAGEMAFGLTVNGHIAPGQALLKGGLQPGQSLLLSKPLGTGTVLAANMLHRAKGRWVEGALECMQISNAGAARVMRRFGATACTDITGFGLLGHLVEMLQAAQLSARIFLEAIPLLPGAEECLQQGWFSSLHVDNARHGQFLHNAADFSHRAKTNILYDPQSAGGLLFSCNPEMAQSCLTALARSGYTAAIIGETQARAGSVGVTLA